MVTTFPNGNFENPQGLMWGVNEAGTNIGANGADPGIYTETVVTTNGNIGVVIFSNISCFGTESLEAETKKIRKILFKYVKHLKT